MAASGPPKVSVPRASTGCGTVITPAPAINVPPVTVSEPPALSIVLPLTVTAVESVTCVPLSTETIRVPEGMPVPYTTMPGAHVPVLTIVSVVEGVPAHARST